MQPRSRPAWRWVALVAPGTEAPAARVACVRASCGGRARARWTPPGSDPLPAAASPSSHPWTPRPRQETPASHAPGAATRGRCAVASGRPRPRPIRTPDEPGAPSARRAEGHQRTAGSRDAAAPPALDPRSCCAPHGHASPLSGSRLANRAFGWLLSPWRSRRKIRQARASPCAARQARRTRGRWPGPRGPAGCPARWPPQLS